MEDQVDGLTGWQRSFLDEAVRSLPPLIEDAVANPTVYARTDKIPRLADLVTGALVVVDHLDTEHLSGLIGLAFDTLLTVGAGSSYRYYEEFLRDAVRLIDVLELRGGPTSRHLLLAARFQAGIRNGDPVRRVFIERAVAAARDAEERVTAELTLARFHIDVSDYPASQLQLAACQVSLTDDALWPLRPDLETTLGLSYYYTEPTVARRHFENAVRLGRDHADRPQIGQPVATALHYLGRLAADRGEFSNAITLFTEGEQLSDEYLAGTGYYHQRIAEILIDHGSASEAHYHLHQAAAIFGQVGMVSTGWIILQGTWARWYLQEGDRTRAAQVLHKAIEAARTETAPRVELILLAELLRLRIQERNAIAVVRIASRAARLYLTAESVGSRRQAIQQANTVFRMAVRFLRPRRGALRSEGGQPIRCPCGADHTVPATPTLPFSPRPSQEI